MKSTTSVTNPTAILQYISAQFNKFTLSTRLYTTEFTSHLFQLVCIWGLNLLMALAVFYAVIRALRLYKSKSTLYDTTKSIRLALKPDFYQLQTEIDALRQELHQLKMDIQEPNNDQPINQ